MASMTRMSKPHDSQQRIVDENRFKELEDPKIQGMPTEPPTPLRVWNKATDANADASHGEDSVPSGVSVDRNPSTQVDVRETQQAFDIDDQGRKYLVDSVFGHRRTRAGYQFHVKWSDGTSTWEPLVTLKEDIPQ
mmetsp:Transcript_19852/g.75073  ORF Transcript_19852/g.75073 Transcript_19852/m.75073 type:complete len:135 (-) Transcript_19852:31-435(-)